MIICDTTVSSACNAIRSAVVTHFCRHGLSSAEMACLGAGVNQPDAPACMHACNLPEMSCINLVVMCFPPKSSPLCCVASSDFFGCSVTSLAVQSPLLHC